MGSQPSLQEQAANQPEAYLNQDQYLGGVSGNRQRQQERSNQYNAQLRQGAYAKQDSTPKEFQVSPLNLARDQSDLTNSSGQTNDLFGFKISEAEIKPNHFNA